MGSFRFRRTFKLAPGIRLNINKRSIGISAGVPGARVSVNSDGRSTRSVGIPGSGLYYRDQTGPRRSAGGKGEATAKHAAMTDDFADTDDGELLRSVVFGQFDVGPTLTLTQILDADEKFTRSNWIDPSDPVAVQRQQQFGITPEKYAEIQKQMDDEAVARNRAAIPQALDQLVQEGLLARSGDTFALTAAGVAERDRRRAEEAAAVATQSTTSESRSMVLSLLGDGGTIEDVLARSREQSGIGVGRSWAQLNLDDLVHAGLVDVTGDWYSPRQA